MSTALCYWSKRMLFCSLILMFLASVVCLQCDSQYSTELQFTITSRRNRTGHWIVEVQMDHGSNGTKDSGPWELQVKQNTVSCDLSQTVRIEATAIAPPKTTQTQDCQIEHEVVVEEGTSREQKPENEHEIVVEEGSSNEQKPETEHEVVIEEEIVKPQKKPPSDYKVVPGLGSYKLHVAPRGWSEAARTCETEDAHLLVLDSIWELMETMRMARQFKESNSAWNDIAWVGISDIFTEGQYVTVLGKPFIPTHYAKWKPGEPTDYRGSTGEDCVYITIDGELFDGNCNSQLAFFCEWNEEPQ